MFLTVLIASIPFIQQIQDVADWIPLSESAIETTSSANISEFEQGLSRFLAIPKEERNFDNTIRAWDAMTGTFGQGIYSLEALLQIHPDKNVRKCLQTTIEKMNRVFLDVLKNHPEIYTVFQEVKNRAVHLNEEEQFYLDQLLEGFEKMGMALSDEERSDFLSLKQEILGLESLFYRNITEDCPVLYAAKEELAGLDDTWISSIGQNEEGKYGLTPDFPTYITVLSECTNPTTRRAMYELFSNRAYPQNEEVIQQLIEKQGKLAKMLGFPSFASYDLSSQMAKSPEQVKTFLAQIKEKARIKADFEYAELLQELPCGVELTPSGQVQRFDEIFLLSRFLHKYYSIDSNKVAEYFPLDKTLQGLIDIYERFFNLSIVEVSHSIPIPDLKALEIRDKESRFLGVILLDLFPREGKCSHLGVCYCLVPPHLPEGKAPYPGVSLLLGNFRKPLNGGPSLLPHEDVLTLFHEFGHALHNIFARNQFLNFSGFNIKIDFVELPSQLLEEWLWDFTILKQISSHYQTHEPLSDQMIQNMIRAHNFGQGIHTLRNCFLSEFALELFSEGEAKNPTQVMRNIWERELPHSACHEENHFHASWWHVPGYGPKYYSYLWTRVFAYDLFETIRRKGLLNPDIGTVYADTILKKGGSRDPNLLLQDFLHREPSLEPFFRELSVEK